MPTSLPVRVAQNPSNDFRLLPHLETPGPDLRVSFDVLDGDRIRARMSGPALPALRGSEHRADLTTRASEVRAAGARLCRRWKQVFVDYQPTDSDGRPSPDRVLRPYASLADLSTEPEHELVRAVTDLVRSGASVLFDVLLRGDDVRVQTFRAYLAKTLAAEGLRIRFDSSELHLPWPMLCLKRSHLPYSSTDEASADAVQPREEPKDPPPQAVRELFPLFLGYRHQIEHTGDSYPNLQQPFRPAQPPSVSLNHDTGVGRKTCAAQVAAALKKGTRLTVREKYHDLVRDLTVADFDEQLMYFWGHGQFDQQGSEPAQLVIRLSDGIPFDGGALHELRADHRRTGTFRPFVFLNACHAGTASGVADHAVLSRALIEHGAQGVLGPQIAMPQVFAAEYALAFVTRYLRGGSVATAGAVALDLARHFATRCHNPLGFAYALHSGMDSHVLSDSED